MGVRSASAKDFKVGLCGPTTWMMLPGHFSEMRKDGNIFEISARYTGVGRSAMPIGSSSTSICPRHSPGTDRRKKNSYVEHAAILLDGCKGVPAETVEKSLSSLEICDLPWEGSCRTGRREVPPSPVAIPIAPEAVRGLGWRAATSTAPPRVITCAG